MAHGYHSIGNSPGMLGLSSGSSAVSVSGNSSGPISFEQYYMNQYGDSNPYSIWNRIGNVFTGKTSSAEQAYQNYLAQYEYERNKKDISEANKKTFEREDNQIQRLMEDYKKAGLNPYLLLSGGNLSSGVASSAAQVASYKRSSKREKNEIDASKALSTAVKVLIALAMLS